MLRYAIRRILVTFPIVLIVFTIVFVIIRVAPGDPAMSMLASEASQEALDALRKEMGLDAPIWLQYLRFLSDLVRGDLGISLLNGVSVAKQLVLALPFTLELTFSAMAFGVIFGIPMGSLPLYGAIRVRII